MRSLRIIACTLALCGLASPLLGAERAGGGVVFKVPAQPELVRHLKLLEFPSYLAMALENNGFSPSQSSHLVVKSRAEFEIRAASVRFLNRKGQVYHYEASVKLPMGDAALRVPVEVDVSALESGSLVVRIFPPLSRLLPSDLLERIEFKVRALANEQAQRQMVRYLDEVARRPRTGDAVDSMLESIVVEAYNRGPLVAASVPGTGPAAPRHDVGDAVPLSEQVALIATLAIWLVFVPLLLLGRIWHRRRHARRGTQKQGA